MAVIQDLPLELLHRIINLAFEDSLSLADMYARRRFLSGASLVARSWRQPAQAALVAEVVICDTKTYPEPFLYKPPASACSVRRLFFYCPAPKDLAMLPQCARLTSLDLDGLSVHGIAADFLTDDLLAGELAHSLDFTVLAADRSAPQTSNSSPCSSP